ncbi:MAG: hypothetical protein V9E96_03735 [Chitinophagaceae bacterium]
MYKIPIRFILDGITAWKDLFSGNSITFKAVFNAHIATSKMVVFWQKKINKLKQSFSQLKGVYTGSIVWQYFIKKTNQVF